MWWDGIGYIRDRLIMIMMMMMLLLTNNLLSLLVCSRDLCSPLGIVISYHPSASGLDTITVTKKYGSYLEMQYNTSYFQMAFVSKLLSLLLSVKLLKITFNPKSLCTNPPNSLVYMHLPGNYSSETLTYRDNMHNTIEIEHDILS